MHAVTDIIFMTATDLYGLVLHVFSLKIIVA